MYFANSIHNTRSTISAWSTQKLLFTGSVTLPHAKPPSDQLFPLPKYAGIAHGRCCLAEWQQDCARKGFIWFQNEELRPWRLIFPIRWQQLQQFLLTAILLLQGRTRELEQGPKQEPKNKRPSQNSRQKEMSVLLPWESSLEKKDGVCAQSMSYSTPNLLAKLGN